MSANYNMGKNSKIQAYTVTNQPVAHSMPFFVSSFGHFICDSSYYTERENYPHYLLLYTVSGAGRLIYEQHNTLLTSGQIAVTDCRRYHYYGCEDNEWDFYWIHFSGVSAGVFTQLVNSEGLEILMPDSSFDFEKYYKSLILLSGSLSRYNEIKISELMRRIFCEITAFSENTIDTQGYSAHQDDIKRAIEYMTEHYDKPLTVDILSEISRISKYYFIRLFQKATGSTPYQYLNLLRVRQSAHLLLYTDLSVCEISRRVGFSNTKNYIACFKKYHELTPLQFRLNSSLRGIRDYDNTGIRDRHISE